MVLIIGAGMAGLLAARMLSPRLKPQVLERAISLPHNHSAVLRFSSNKVSEVLGIPFKKVQLIKTVIPWRNPVADAMAYSRKVLGEYRSDRSVLLPERWQSSERYIAPENLIEQMAEGVDVTFDCDYDFPAGAEKVISTIPMPVLAAIMNYDRPLHWKWINGKNVVTRVEKCEAYVSVMVPDPNVPFSRASITKDQLIIELCNPEAQHWAVEKIIYKACNLLGITERCDDFKLIDQNYAKIAPIDEAERRNFIYWASTVTGRAYQLGRFATWRPRLLLDDLVQDVRLIESWITSSSSCYDQQLHQRRAI